MANCYYCTSCRFNSGYSSIVELYAVHWTHSYKYSAFNRRIPTNVGISRGYRLLIPTIPVFVFLYLFYQLGSFLPIERNVFLLIPTRTITEACVLRIGAMGVTFMAVLSGFGSICAGWETYLTPHRFGIF